MDEDLRALERRWRESGALHDEVALIARRLRAGTLSQERLDLAVWLGHEAACRVAGKKPKAPQEPLRRWFETLWEATGDEGAVRAALAAGSAAVDLVSTRYSVDTSPLRAALESVARYLVASPDVRVGLRPGLVRSLRDVKPMTFVGTHSHEPVLPLPGMIKHVVHACGSITRTSAKSPDLREQALDAVESAALVLYELHEEVTAETRVAEGRGEAPPKGAREVLARLTELRAGPVRGRVGTVSPGPLGETQGETRAVQRAIGHALAPWVLNGATT